MVEALEALMTGYRLTRRAKRRWRTAFVWATLPVVLLNGRTLVGCGCTGHFDSACRCTGDAAISPDSSRALAQSGACPFFTKSGDKRLLTSDECGKDGQT